MRRGRPTVVNNADFSVDKMTGFDLTWDRFHDLKILIITKSATQTGRIDVKLKGRTKEEAKDKTKEGSAT